jgi:hypothetical protein
MVLFACLIAAGMDLAALQTMSARFSPTELSADLGALPPSERASLAKIIEAARLMDTLYLRQVWSGNEPLLLQLSRDATPLGRARLHLFVLQKGPWSSLDHDAPLIPGVPAKPPEANFYPPGSTKEEIESWQKSLPPGEREVATGFYTTIRRTPQGGLAPVPYGIEYQDLLGRAAKLLRDAAQLTQQPTLKRFLATPADAFVSNH